METTKEKAPILEQVIGGLEKKTNKWIWVYRLGIIVYVILFLVLVCCFYYSPLSSMIDYFILLLIYRYYILGSIVGCRKKELLPMIRNLKVYIKSGVPEMYVESKGEKCYNNLEHKRISKIINLLSIKADDVSFFWENLRKEIDRLPEPRKADYLLELVELEKFFTHL